MNTRAMLAVAAILLLASTVVGGFLAHHRLQDLAQRNETVHQTLATVEKLVALERQTEESQIQITELLRQAREEVKRAEDRAVASGTDLLQGLWIAGPALIVILGGMLLAVVIRPLQRAGRARSAGDAAAAVAGVSSQLADLLRDLDEERRERLLALVRAGHLAALGTLAAGIAHEVRNPLMTISILAGGSLEKLGEAPGDGDLRERLVQIESESRRAGRLLGDLLALAPIDSGIPSELDLREEASEAIRLAKSRHRDDADVQLASTGPVTIQGLAARWRQVFLNLIDNALDATDGLGPVSIDIGRDAEMATVRIHDNGAGFDAETGAQLFEPFFTTKQNTGSSDSGFGLGLFVAEGLVRAAGGSLVALSPGLDRGATFEIRIPLVEGS